jgi:hypothetical protein
MPINYENYPPNWKAISLRIREREGNRCKWCAAPNHTEIVRSSVEPVHYIVFDDQEGGYSYPDGQLIRLSEIPGEYDISKGIRVVLTVAHLNHDITDNSDGNLAALCQRCHLRHDSQHHASNSKRTRAAKKVAQLKQVGQMSLFDSEAQS